VQELLDEHLGKAELSGPDRRLTTQLVYGVLRRRETLSRLLLPHLRRPVEEIETWLWEALRLGAYQIAILTSIPPHAALNETVELAALRGKHGAKGFLNGILRAVSRTVTDDRSDRPAANALPLEEGRYRLLNRAVFPDPELDFAGYVAEAFALPEWLVNRWVTRITPEDCLRLAFWFAGTPPLWLRVNPLRMSRERLLEGLTGAGIAAEAGSHPQSIRLLETRPVRELPGFAEGWFTIQDESAMHPASALAPSPGSSVLDLCAAPGGKTTHLAEIMMNEGRIVACDTDPRRLNHVRDLAKRLGLGIIDLCPLKEDGEPPAGPFDAVLADVPCSNTGVLGRRPEIRWRLRAEDMRHLKRLQAALLRRAYERVRPGGTIVYSTCSIEPEENGRLVRNVLREIPGLTLEGEELRLPGQPADGGYWARLRRTL
jgi:16S rRNA (cytosine967-C5)-methyltransferase